VQLLPNTLPQYHCNDESSLGGRRLIDLFCVATRLQIKNPQAALQLASTSAIYNTDYLEMDLAILVADSINRPTLASIPPDLFSNAHPNHIRIVTFFMAEDIDNPIAVHYIFTQIRSVGLKEDNTKLWERTRTAMHWLCLTKHAFIVSLLDSEDFLEIAPSSEHITVDALRVSGCFQEDAWK
jgi:hypothetical protein